ncbi:MAG: ATP-binding protein [Acidobacteria bacterium]|nr:ATP-binding protein [Acidobacteriota bacterium]
MTREAGEVPVVLSVKDVVSTHLAILASTGAGKSYTAGVLVEELMSPHNRASVLVVDPHGEYGTLSSLETDARFADGNYRPEVKVFTPERIRVRFSSLTEADIKYLLPEGTSDKMLHYLSQAYRKLRASVRGENETYAYHDLRDAVTAEKYGDEDGRGASGSSNVGSIDALLWRLDSRFDNTHRPDALFHDREHIPLQDIFVPGRCTVLQLSDIEQNEQQVIVATLLRRVNKARMATVRGESTSGENFLPYPVFTLVEEAHRFAPAGATVVSTNILKQILSEGRKFGVGVGLITQRPGKLDQDVLSQCMTQVIMRIVNPVDQDTVAKSVEGAGRQLLQELPALTKGQAVISGVGVNTPVMCRVRERCTRHGGETFDAPSEWASWHGEAAQERRAQDEAVLVKPSAKKVEKFRGVEL